MNSPQSYGIHWFRRDLRLAGNPALLWNVERHAGRVLGVFFFDSTFLSRPDFSHNRFAFFLKTLEALQSEMRQCGGELLVLDSPPALGFPKLFENLKSKPGVVSFNRDYEPFARSRDAAVSALLQTEMGIEVHTERDHLVIEPHEITKGSSGYYQIYTPFAKTWLQKLNTSEIQKRISAQVKPTVPRFTLQWKNVEKTPGTDFLKSFQEKNAPQVTVEMPATGTAEALQRLQHFEIDTYKTQRELPAVDGTSGMSIYFKNGSITTAQVIAKLGLKAQHWDNESGASRYLKEIIWREFYYHILWHEPRVEKEAFNQKYKAIAWENRRDFFELWKQGKTGYPLVDAGMRQLNQTGWMHNRVRMVVASFLTKDLLIDWRWGERYFMRMLLDGDLAPNNGGWQWAASTGCDPQPYFRIFNPTLQAEKFDPDGTYIKRYLPERAQLVGKAIHAPQNPIVDHAGRKLKALSLYRVDR